MNLAISIRGDLAILAVSGAVDRNASGRLHDALVGCVRGGMSKLIIDLSHARGLTRAGVRGLVAAARLLTTARGEMRICGAAATEAALLRSLGFDHLLKLDPELAFSVAAMSRPADGTLRHVDGFRDGRLCAFAPERLAAASVSNQKTRPTMPSGQFALPRSEFDHRRGGTLGQAGAALARGVLRYLRDRRDHRHLSELPDYLLDDIGLTRGQIRRVTRRRRD